MEFKITLSAEAIRHLMVSYDYDNLDKVSWDILEDIRYQIKKHIEEKAYEF